MKLFIVFSVLIASALALPAVSGPFDPSFEQQQPGQAANPDFSQLNDDDWSPFSNPNQEQHALRVRLPEGALDRILGRQQQRPQNQDSNNELGNAPASAAMDFWQTYPDAAPFDAKIRGRLEASTALSKQPEIRQKLMEIAEGKFNECKGKVDNVERACLGRATGQVMQLVSAVETMSRNQH